jgi:hypothetical protein
VAESFTTLAASRALSIRSAAATWETFHGYFHGIEGFVAFAAMVHITEWRAL